MNYWIKNCDDKLMLIIFGCIYGYRIVDKNICDCVMNY